MYKILCSVYGLAIALSFGILLYACNSDQYFDVLDLSAKDATTDGGDLKQSDEIQFSNQGYLPPGFNQRHCQWDNPACGQPVPGGLNPLLDPIDTNR